MALGLGNYLYELEVKGGNANFNFWDSEDADNTAEVTVNEKDFGGFSADSRQVAEIAFSQVSKTLNDKRDARIKREAAERLEADMDEKARAREASEDFLNHAQEGAVQPAKVEDDGTRVYNTGAPARDDASAQDSSSDNSDNSSNKKSK